MNTNSVDEPIVVVPVVVVYEIMNYVTSAQIAEIALIGSVGNAFTFTLPYFFQNISIPNLSNPKQYDESAKGIKPNSYPDKRNNLSPMLSHPLFFQLFNGNL